MSVAKDDICQIGLKGSQYSIKEKSTWLTL